MPLKWDPRGSGRQDTSECEERGTSYGCSYPLCQQRGNLGCNTPKREAEARAKAEEVLSSIIKGKISEAELNAMVVGMVRAMKAYLPKDVGAILLLFNRGEGGFMAYASTAERASMIEAMREMIAKLEGN
jgi:hypothetical protein